MKPIRSFKLSVIVPVFNVESYLSQCIESLLIQSISDLQIILIDDGSTDLSGNICDSYAEKDNRITVVHQNNKGVSAARNAGLKLATGKYIAFVDSDDVLPMDAYERMLEMEEADLIIGRMQIMNEDGTLDDTCSSFPEKSISKNEFLIDLFEEKKYSYLGYVFDKIFCNQIIRKANLFFKEKIRLNEDRLFLLEYILWSDNICTVNNVVYYYRQRNAGIIRKTRRNKTVTDSELTVIDSFQEMQKICKLYSMNLYYICCRKSFESALDLLNRVSKQDKDKRKVIKLFLKQSARCCLKTPEYGLIERAKIIAHTLLGR